MEIALGVDLGWVSQLESQGIHWINAKGDIIDPIQELKSMGADSVRLRVFVNPPKEAYWKKNDGTVCMLGFCDAQSVLELSKRVKANGMKLMIDFHYSDHFADPQYQDIPKAWEKDSVEELTSHVYQHTKEVLTLLTQNEISPEWVQVGNEINPGILLPHGSLKDNPKQLVDLLNAGYDAVKECCPECQVITHLAALHSEEWCVPFLDNFFQHNGKTDIIGFSYYPYWFKIEKEAEFLRKCLMEYVERYKKPVLIAEVGGEETDEQGTYQLLLNTIEAVRSIPENKGVGVFYWEPDVGADLLPDQYPLGAARLVGKDTLQFTKAMTAYKDSKNR